MTRLLRCYESMISARTLASFDKAFLPASVRMCNNLPSSTIHHISDRGIQQFKCRAYKILKVVQCVARMIAFAVWCYGHVSHPLTPPLTPPPPLTRTNRLIYTNNHYDIDNWQWVTKTQYLIKHVVTIIRINVQNIINSAHQLKRFFLAPPNQFRHSRVEWIPKQIKWWIAHKWWSSHGLLL